MIELEPPIGERELPAVFPSPFDGTPHPIARRAAEQLLAELRRMPLDEGKMFGVLVVRDAGGRLGYLQAFSGMLAGRWTREGFAPPLFDAAAWERMWPAGQAALREHDQRLAAIDADGDRARRRMRLEGAASVWASMSRALRDKHKANKAARDAARAAGGADAEALAQQSRADTAER
ncbi:MAG: RluA family pseudouridine synthase, partial [Myxococcales bacterium]|nr:RluA family pseudouridine synthase [Myxococcales bacterium]